jgi:hypothetical protein
MIAVSTCDAWNNAIHGLFDALFCVIADPAHGVCSRSTDRGECLTTAGLPRCRFLAAESVAAAWATHRSHRCQRLRCSGAVTAFPEVTAFLEIVRAKKRRDVRAKGAWLC